MFDFIKIVLALVVLYFIVTQMIIPAIQGTAFFPLFRDKEALAKAEKSVKSAVDTVVTDVKDVVAKAKSSASEEKKQGPENKA